MWALVPVVSAISTDTTFDHYRKYLHTLIHWVRSRRRRANFGGLVFIDPRQGAMVQEDLCSLNPRQRSVVQEDLFSLTALHGSVVQGNWKSWSRHWHSCFQKHWGHRMVMANVGQCSYEPLISVRAHLFHHMFHFLQIVRDRFPSCR